MVLENFLADADILWDRAGKKLFEKPEARTGRIMRVQVTNRGVVEDLTGYTLNLGWTSTKDETKIGLDAFEAADITKGIFELEYTSGMLTNIGTLKATLQLVPVAGNTVESDNFVITVTKSAVDAAAVQSETSFTALASALVSVNDWNARIDAVEADFIQRANDMEAIYPQQLLSLGSQLADKVGGGVKAEPEDLSATTLGLVTGTGGPINLLSIPQDKSATWAKRTETGSFAKILLTGEVPNFNTSTGILTFPSDFRILVGTNYYSIAATTIDFSALVSTASQILILFDVSTLAFTAISPTSLTSAHDRSVIVATIKNVSGQRREPYMNCPFTVNNIPYVPDIEKMLLSKAIPLTNQITLFHVSGVLNMIQHKDSLGNTIRTDTFTFSPTTIVEERKHNLSNTKITFTTNLSTFTTEVN